LLVLYAGAEASENAPVPDFREVTELVAGNTAFAVDLYRQIVSEVGTGNIFFSPYSISTALGMTYAGAEGQTEAEMAEVLHFSLPQETLHLAFASLRGELVAGNLSGAASGEPFTMFVANGLWVQEGFDLLDRYVSQVTSCYDATVTNLDLAGDSEGSTPIQGSYSRMLSISKPPGSIRSMRWLRREVSSPWQTVPRSRFR